MEQVNIIGLDLGKRTFQLHGSHSNGGVAFRKKVSRDKVLTFLGSVSLSMQSEEQGRSEPPKIAWGSDIFSRSGRDLKARSSAKLNSHTSSESYSMSRPLLCTESETDPIEVPIDNWKAAREAEVQKAAT
jgi:hypothetical protein